MNIPSRANAKARRKQNYLRHSFKISALFGDPFAVSSVSIATIAWVITIAGAIASASDSETFPRFTWWGIAYQIAIIIIILGLYCYNIIDYYKNFLTAACSIAFIYNTNSATNLVYSSGPRKAASSAGVILLSIINLLWIFYFGGDNASPTNRWIDSFSLQGIRPSAYELALIRSIRRRTIINNGRTMPAHFDNQNIDELNLNINSNRVANSNHGYSDKVGPYMTSHELTGLESTDVLHQNNTDTFQSQPNNGSYVPSTEYHDTQEHNTFMTDSSMGNTDTTMGDTLDLYSDLGEDSFPYTAKALYSYKADDDDGYEISFEQGEILKVSDIEGRWWKSRRENGETGIIPSNYVQLIDATNI